MYRLGIWLIALTLVFNGAAMYATNDLPEMSMAFAQGHHHDAGAAACDVHSDDLTAMAANSGPIHGHAHGHLKCCGTCNVASVLPSAVGMAVALSYKTASFRMAQRDLVGHLVTLDPGIPKSIV